MKKRLVSILAALLLTPLPALRAADKVARPERLQECVLVEAEGFAQRGGWVVDPQFMDQMGSPYLLAHGLGRPVADATTEVEFPATGTYRVWVRTKDWVAQWKAPGAPGKFQLLVNGQPLDTTFGTEGAEWHWQDGGKVDIAERRVRLALHDLTGFEGRCDAILFARDAQFTPPNRDPEMAAFRRTCLGLPEQPEPAGEFDLVVTGGGIAGTCAAISAARLGLKVALIQDRPVLGGNNSSEVRVWLQGARNKEPWPRIGDVVAELEQQKRAHYGPDNTAELYEDEKKLALVRAEPNIRLFLEHRVNAVETDGGKIRAVIAQEINTGRRVRIAGRWFADCTGDAAVGALAGADFEIEPKGHMGPCNLWNVCECKDTNALNTAVDAQAEPQPFPRCPWALDLTDKPFPGRSKTKPDTKQLGGWYWESGFDRDPIAEMEYVRDWNFRAMYGAWDAMKNVDKVLPNHRLNWAAHILGKRESRRLMGDVVLCFDDLKNDRQFPDGCVPTGWSNDLHLPDSAIRKGLRGRRLHLDARISANSPPPRASAVLDSLPLSLLAQRRQPLHGRARHQHQARRARRGARDADRRLHGRDRRHGGEPVQEARRHAARHLRTLPERTPGPDAPRRRQESRRACRASPRASQDRVSACRSCARLAGESRSESGPRRGSVGSGRFPGGVFTGAAQRRQGGRGRQQRPLAEHAGSAARGRVHVEGGGHDRRRANRLGLFRRHGLGPD